MPDGFWLGFASGALLAPAALAVKSVWRRYGWRIRWSGRIIPPPTVGRWQVWAVSAYHGVPDRMVGRYRLRWSARIVAWGQTRQTPRTTYQQFDVRRAAAVASTAKEIADA
ncbi:hypothetical protein AB0B94_31250 [Micromonospora sp. NPDC048986]|uniref:hypothetical protein n=1 Tax=Micromonospora sp. NPDC048986 TaxID=3155644 RepID=UPI0033C8532D